MEKIVVMSKNGQKHFSPVNYDFLEKANLGDVFLVSKELEIY